MMVARCSFYLLPECHTALWTSSWTQMAASTRSLPMSWHRPGVSAAVTSDQSQVSPLRVPGPAAAMMVLAAELSCVRECQSWQSCLLSQSCHPHLYHLRQVIRSCTRWFRWAATTRRCSASSTTTWRMRLMKDTQQIIPLLPNPHHHLTVTPHLNKEQRTLMYR